MPPRKKLVKRKKSSSSTPDDNHHESPTPELETKTESTNDVKFDVVEIDVSIQEQVSNPNLTEIKSVDINPQQLINVDGGELDGVRHDEPVTQKVDLQETENNVEAVVVVKSDDNEKGEEIAEVFLAQESNVSKAPCKNNDALVVEDGCSGGVKGLAEIVPSHESAQGASTQTSCENKTALDVKDDSKDGGDDDDNDGDGADHEDQDHSLPVQDPPDDKKDKGVEIYVGKLDKDTVEDDLVNVFQQFGELKSIRIVRTPITKKSKGFAFVRFASIDQAKRALFELKDGFEVRGKHVMVSASLEKDTLFLGNICKTWKKEEVLQQLKHYGIEHIETIRIPEDPKIDQKIKGFAFLEFTTHSDATEAFQRLQKPDVSFGRDISVKVAFARAPMHSSDEDLSRFNQVFVEGLTKDWNEEKVKEICNKYGEIVKVNLCQSSGTKQRGFVTFASPESALACVEGINNTAIGGEAKIIAGIVKSRQKTARQKQVFSGGFKVEKQTDVSVSHKEGGISDKYSEPKSSKMKGVLNTQQSKRNKKGSSKREVKIKTNTVKPQEKGSHKKDDERSKAAELPKMKADLNFQQAKSKRKASSEQKLNARDQGTHKKPKKGGEGENSNTISKAGNHKRKKATTYGGREDRGQRNTHDKKPLKKQKGNMHERERYISRNPKGDTSSIRRHDDYRNSTRYTDPYAPKYDVFASPAYHLGPDSLSARRLKEMEPHAGYIEPSSATRSLSYSRYVQPVVRTPHTQHQTVYLEPAPTSQSHLHSRYLDCSGLSQSHRGYIETAVVPKVQPYRDYRSSEYVPIAHDPYDSGLASRVVRHDGRGAGILTYVGGPQPPASSQVRNHISYYQGSSSYSGAYSSQRTYY